MKRRVALPVSLLAEADWLTDTDVWVKVNVDRTRGVRLRLDRSDPPGWAPRENGGTPRPRTYAADEPRKISAEVHQMTLPADAMRAAGIALGGSVYMWFDASEGQHIWLVPGTMTRRPWGPRSIGATNGRLLEDQTSLTA